MTNDSSTGGYLAPTPPPAPTPLTNDPLTDFLQAVIVNLTGLPGPMVFPRWQVTPPTIPEVTVNWASIGIMEVPADTFAYEAHNPIVNQAPFPPLPTPAPTPAPNGFDILIRHEQLQILASFYGPAALGNAGLVRDGLSIGQNRELMQLARMGLVSCGDMKVVPSIVNAKWYYRIDMPISINREVVRYYPILDILNAPVTVTTDTGIIENITTTNP